MARTTKPELVAPKDMSEDGRDRLALFLSTTWQRPDVTQTILHQAGGIGEFLAAGAREEPDSESASEFEHISWTIGRLLEAEVDLDVEPDSETVAAMRRDIAEANRISPIGERRRTIRMATFAGEVATWRALHENSINQSPPYLEVLGGGGSGAESLVDPAGMSTAAFAPEPMGNTFGDRFPEIA